MKITIVCSCLLLQVLGVFSQIPAIYDVVLHEIMIKPAPVVGLPPFEYIELRNVSAFPVQLKNWRLAVNKREVLLPAYLLQPDSLLLLCAPAAVNSYNISNVRGIDRFPALPDDSGIVVLYDHHKKVMHAIAYDLRWYGNSHFNKGGYSLEMVNAAFPCSGKMNWRAGIARSGGTPGAFNKAADTTLDMTTPDLLYTSVTDSLHVFLHFSKTLDSALAADPARYLCSGGLTVKDVIVLPPLFKTVQLRFDSPMLPQQLYTISTTGLADCKGEGSSIGPAITCGIPQSPDKSDILINELLFYPPPGIPEFIELYNRSPKVIALNQLRICARKENGKLGSVMLLAPEGRLLMPGQWVALTTDITSLCSYYSCKVPQNLQEVSSLPVMPKTEGGLVLIRADSVLLDELQYTDKQHYPLIDVLQGISLERFQNGNNWHSAAATAGYATPGWFNSQQEPEGENQTVTLLPAVFSPDFAELVRLSWQLPVPGCICNVTIFDVQGKPVRFLARNLLVGNAGYLQWDGSGENKLSLPAGIYLFFIEVYNLNGYIKRWKRTVVMARKLI